jgi:transposase
VIVTIEEVAASPRDVRQARIRELEEQLKREPSKPHRDAIVREFLALFEPNEMEIDF